MPGISALVEVVGAFGKLGLMSFGGPTAHLAYFRHEFVARRRWLSDPAYADLVALCQFLPGPASSQVVFALGMLRAGLPGALAASLAFMLPSVVLMIALAYGLASAQNLHGAGWLHGLKLAAVAIVAQAVWTMGRSICVDSARAAICLLAALAALAAPGPLTQVVIIAGGGTLGWLLYRRAPVSAAPPEHTHIRGHRAALAALLIFAGLLITLPSLAQSTGSRSIAVFDSFYRSGSMVFGGGHVVLPLLREEVVPRGWVADDAFLAGYGAAQALPGPLFTFAAYLGALIYGGRHAWLGGLLAVVAIFLPAWLLVGGALPFWAWLRSKAWAQATLRGANAAVVGLLLAALWRPVITETIGGLSDTLAAAAAFAALLLLKVPQWAVVLAMAAAGHWLLAA